MGFNHPNKPTVPYQRQLVENDADADYTAPASLGDGSTILQSAALTATRDVVLPTNAFAGQICHVVRDVGATGTDDLDVGPGLKILEVSEWATFCYTGTAWILIAFGAGVT